MKQKIRLKEEEIKAIIEVAKKVFGENTKIWLFGSRVDPNKRGGDIDIYIETSNLNNLLRKKLDFLIKLENKIGEQKIDVIIKPLDSEDKISIITKNSGVRLI